MRRRFIPFCQDPLPRACRYWTSTVALWLSSPSTYHSNPALMSVVGSTSNSPGLTASPETGVLLASANPEDPDRANKTAGPTETNLTGIIATSFGSTIGDTPIDRHDGPASLQHGPVVEITFTLRDHSRQKNRTY